MLDLDKNKKYLLACSFGPDSMALFHMLLTEGYKFDVAHVNYGVRKEAEQETISLYEYCGKNDISIEAMYAKKVDNFSNFEAKARDLRYKFFKSLFDKNGYDALLVAHHQDDVLETYFLQRKRGGYVEHYGIAYKTNIYGMEVLRPLLNYSKQDLLDYDNEHNIPYGIDSSNLSNDFARNVIRHNIIEKMRPADKAQTLKEIEDANVEIDVLYERLYATDLENVDELLKLSDDEFQRAMVIQARKVELDSSISSDLAEEIKKILLSKKPNVAFKIHNGLIFMKEYTWCGFVEEDKEFLYSYVIDSPRKFETEYFFLDFSNGGENRNVKLDDYPITVRCAKKGDEVMINNYSVEIRRLFIDWKMPLSLRKRWPLIVNKHNKVIYVPRYRKEFKVKEDSNFYVKIK